jgi:hypothetical protein
MINQTSGGSSSELASAVTCDPWGNVFIAGNHDSDPLVFGNSILSADNNGYDFFTARLGAGVTAIDELNDNSFITIYPNPSSGVIHYNSTEDIISVTVSDLSGKKVFEEKNPNNNIDLNSLAAGTYVAKFFSKEKISLKLVLVGK